MSSRFRFASAEDGAGILNIMESDVAKGDLQLLYTRRPNPFDSFKKESPKAVVGIYEDNGKTVGTIAGIPREMYVGGRRRTVCYVTNMKRAADHKGYIKWKDAFDAMYDPLDSQVYYCSVVKDNAGVLKMLKKKRKGMPYAEELDGYRTYIISPTAPVRNYDKKLTFRRAAEEDAAAVIRFLKTHGSRRNLFAAFDRFDGITVPKITDFYLLFDGEEIAAAGALWDRSDSKQYVLKKCSGKMAFVRLLNPLLSLLGYIKLPKEGQQAAFTFLSFFLAKEDSGDFYRTFLYHIRREVKKTHAMFVLGTNDHNPKRAVLDKIRAISFDTTLCEIVMSEFRGAERVKYDPAELEAECAYL
ncbi:MAG: hypothetical protein J5845_03780 [Lachnospiraceae bacterium]|nr:hypothetical protein [Lachnospiraceae bacterium]